MCICTPGIRSPWCANCKPKPAAWSALADAGCDHYHGAGLAGGLGHPSVSGSYGLPKPAPAGLSATIAEAKAIIARLEALVGHR